MNNWEETTLGEVVEITSSKRIFHADYVNSGVLFYRSKEIIERQAGQKISTDLYITKEKFEEIKNKFGVPIVGDLLLTSVGTLGIPYIVKGNDKFYFKDGNLTWFKNFNGLSVQFLYYWILSFLGREALKSIMIGSTQSAITIVGLKSLNINLPLLLEQKAIAKVLNSLDDKIELLRKQNETLEKIAQTIFKRWFVEFEFDGRKLKIKNGIPEGWRVGSLSDIANITIGRTPSRKEEEWFSFKSSDRKWISIKDMGLSGVYINNTSEYLTQEAVNKFNVPAIPKNTVILSFKMTVGRVAITTEEMFSNEAIAHIKLKDNSLYAEYVYLFLKRFNFNELGSTSSIVTAVNSQSIKKIEMIIPDKQIMNDFKVLVQPIFKKILNNQLQIQTFSRLRDTLLPKLMSGEVRVK